MIERLFLAMVIVLAIAALGFAWQGAVARWRRRRLSTTVVMWIPPGTVLSRQGYNNKRETPS